MTKSDWGSWAADKLMVPAVTALLVIGGGWVTLHNVKADMTELKAEHSGPHSHALLNARVDILEKNGAKQGRNVYQICVATGATCEF